MLEIVSKFKALVKKLRRQFKVLSNGFHYCLFALRQFGFHDVMWLPKHSTLKKTSASRQQPPLRVLSLSPLEGGRERNLGARLS